MRRFWAGLGASWLAAPGRRVVQALALLAFLLLFFFVCWPYGGEGYEEHLRAKELLPAESFLALDPLVGLSAALAARMWLPALVWAGALLGLCLFFPRGFCGYLCPLGTTIDLFDWAVGRRVTGLRLKRRGWWVQLKYYLLAGVLAAAAAGAMLAGFVAAIPVVTRGLLFLLAPLQLGGLRGWHQIPPLDSGQFFSVLLFLAIFGLSFPRPRFWCRYVCPTGAVFSAANLLRLTGRTVNANCVECDSCIEVCPFDAIEHDYSTRGADCTFCQTCGGACPAGAIEFGVRGMMKGRNAPGEPVADRPALSRRGFVNGVAGGLVFGVGVRTLWGAGLVGLSGETDPAFRPVRPPGSVPEREFLQLCVRCGLCFQVCPNRVLQPVAWEQWIEGVWTPQVVARWSGCEPSCNNCGQVCPTGAIRPLPLAEKRVARIGLAEINRRTCLPLAGREACQLCIDECQAAGYDALEFIRVGVEVDGAGQPVEGSGFLAPVVLPEKCNGCGLCETRCHHINVKEKRLLAESAIIVNAGPGKEDRLLAGSYLELRAAERREREKQKPPSNGDGGYLPDFLK